MKKNNLVLAERYAKWVGKPLPYVTHKINTGQLNAFTIDGKDYIKLAKHRVEFYRNKEK